MSFDLFGLGFSQTHSFEGSYPDSVSAPIVVSRNLDRVTSSITSCCYSGGGRSEENFPQVSPITFFLNICAQVQLHPLATTQLPRDVIVI